MNAQELESRERQLEEIVYRIESIEEELEDLYKAKSAISR